MTDCKPIVTDTYDFPTLIEGGCVYVDKTAYLHRMISGVDGSLFFMSRPRRFGKSLMLSTLEQIFKGNRDLFKGLAIDGLKYDWKKFPVLRLDMSIAAADDAVGFRKALCSIVRSAAVKLGCDLGDEDNPGLVLSQLLDKVAARGERLAVLIDEYDSPIAGLLNEKELLDNVRKQLYDFYTVLKAHVADIRFLLMTGVSKFAKLSAFSGMNNLTDLTMAKEYAGLLGYSREEVETNLKPQIEEFADKSGMTAGDIVSELMEWYDSYRFSPESEVKVCNPVSIGRALKEQRFYGFWDATGNASLIIECLRKAKKTSMDLDGLIVRPEQLDVCDAARLPIESLLYQGGYLTIDRVEPSGLLVLRVPNKEVRQALDCGYVSTIMQENADEFINSALHVTNLLDSESDCALALKRVITLIFAMIPHEWKAENEAEVKRYFLLFVRMAGGSINAEVESLRGRADAVLKTSKAVYVFEFKYDKSTAEALKQCRDRDYALPYACDRRKVVCVGVNYDSENRTVEVATEVVTKGVGG